MCQKCAPNVVCWGGGTLKSCDLREGNLVMAAVPVDGIIKEIHSPQSRLLYVDLVPLLISFVSCLTL